LNSNVGRFEDQIIILTTNPPDRL